VAKKPSNLKFPRKE